MSVRTLPVAREAPGPAEPKRCVETFVVESWAEHLRQHVTVTDKAVEEQAYAFHRGASPPLVSHLISAYTASLSVPEEGLAPIERDTREP